MSVLNSDSYRKDAMFEKRAWSKYGFQMEYGNEFLRGDHGQVYHFDKWLMGEREEEDLNCHGYSILRGMINVSILLVWSGASNGAFHWCIWQCGRRNDAKLFDVIPTDHVPRWGKSGNRETFIKFLREINGGNAVSIDIKRSLPVALIFGNSKWWLWNWLGMDTLFCNNA